MNDGMIWLMVRTIEDELRDTRLARSARHGATPTRPSLLAFFRGRRPGRAAIGAAPAQLRGA
jgi:hypothetical protein